MGETGKGIVLETARLILRPPEAGDLDWLLAKINTARVMRHLGGVQTVDQVAEGLAQDIAAFADGGYRRWTVCLRDGGDRVGRCGLFTVRAAAAPPGMQGGHEVGWTLAEQAFGHGYATEAARAILGFAFGQLDLPCVFAQTSDANASSGRVMDRLGFARAAELDYDDPEYPPHENPTRVYRLSRSQWEAIR